MNIIITINLYLFIKNYIYNYKKKLLKKIFNKNKLLSGFKFID